MASTMPLAGDVPCSCFWPATSFGCGLWLIVRLCQFLGCAALICAPSQAAQGHHSLLLLGYVVVHAAFHFLRRHIFHVRGYGPHVAKRVVYGAAPVAIELVLKVLLHAAARRNSL